MLDKPRLLVVITGGTITQEPKTLDGLHPLGPSSQVKQSLKDFLTGVTIAQVDIIDLMNKDSTNMKPEDWVVIATAIHQRLDRYDGAVVIHGTDTMAHTAGALAMAFGKGLQKPIVLTGSQVPFGAFGSDASFNVENALKVAVKAVNRGIAEVMISFAYQVLRGCRARKRSEVDFNAFESPAFDPLAEIRQEIYFYPWARQRNNYHLSFRADFRKGVFITKLAPGMEPDMLRSFLKANTVTAVVIESFGAGNVPNDYLSIINEAINEMRIPVVITTPFIGGMVRMDLYETGAAALMTGAIPAGDMTSEMTTVKLMWLLANESPTLDNLRVAITCNYVGEITEV